MVTTRIDEKGRISIPANIREQLGLESGNVLFLDVQKQILRITNAANPFDALIDEAVEEIGSGETQSLREFAAEEGINLS